MTLPVAVDRAAARDIADAAKWYRASGPGLGDGFLRAVQVGLAQIERTPLAHPVVDEDVRRVLLGRFPFALFYLVEREGVVVVACLHGRRSPGVWLRRVRSFRGQ